MPYITREDGEHFVIPSYRDVLSTKKKALIKREILLLSEKYGEFITLQRKSSDQYEVAFSPDTGYLLGESIWNYFKRPPDLIYCEAIPNTNEVILVIVKGNSVYLDGSFPSDSIAEELVVFKTQQNNFDVHIYGNVPISQEPEPGKFSLNASSVKSFNVLPAPVFPKLPRLKMFQLKLVDQVLREHGIGVFPLKRVILFIVLLSMVWMGYFYFTVHKKELPQFVIQAVNPYQSYYDQLNSPDPSVELESMLNRLSRLYTAPGWRPENITYTNRVIRTKMISRGLRTKVLLDWGKRNEIPVTLDPAGYFVSIPVNVYNRRPVKNIMPIKDLISGLIDRYSYIIPGDNLRISPITNTGKFFESNLTILFNNITLSTFSFLGKQLKNLPIILTGVVLNPSGDGMVSGSISIKVLGN